MSSRVNSQTPKATKVIPVDNTSIQKINDKNEKKNMNIQNKLKD